MVIQVDIKNKIAELSAPALIVCGNSDYVVNFNFDEEWDEHRIRTARFSTWNGYTDVVFEGSECPVPVLSRATFVKVGVFAGDLHTTTPAFIPCKKSIRCEGGAPIEPTPDVYAQLIQLIESGAVRGPQGEKGEKGEKGDAGAVKFIPVAELPAENVDESAIYLVPTESTEEENRFNEYAYIDGKWEVLGAISLQVDHSEYVKFTDRNTFVKGGVVENTETLTDEEKTSACEWLGALKKVSDVTTFTKVYCKGTAGTQDMYTLHVNANANAIPLRTYLGSLNAKMSGSYRADELTNMEYVHNLPNNLTLTDEEKEKWLAWLGAVSKEGEDVAYGGLYGYTWNPTNQKIFKTSITPRAGAIAQYNSRANEDGVLKSGKPEEDDDCTPKKWVEDLVASSHMVNITQMHTIYDSEEAIQGVVPEWGNGSRFLVKTNGSLPLYYYTYNSSENKWEKGYQIKDSTIYLNLEDSGLYRYTMSSSPNPYPYFRKLAPTVEEVRTWRMTLKYGDYVMSFEYTGAPMSREKFLEKFLTDRVVVYTVSNGIAYRQELNADNGQAFIAEQYFFTQISGNINYITIPIYTKGSYLHGSMMDLIRVATEEFISGVNYMSEELGRFI